MSSDPPYTPKRKARRVEFSSGIPVRIVAVDGTWRRDCLMMDAADGGAKLTVKQPVEGLDLKEFFLVLSTTGSAYRRCELVWLNGDQLGVRFLGPGNDRSGNHLR
jgi:PilZ domain